MRSVRSRLLASGLIASLLLGATPLAAQTTSLQAWPQRTVKFLLPLGPRLGRRYRHAPVGRSAERPLGAAGGGREQAGATPSSRSAHS
jgi:hypothetical protein